MGVEDDDGDTYFNPYTDHFPGFIPDPDTASEVSTEVEFEAAARWAGPQNIIGNNDNGGDASQPAQAAGSQEENDNSDTVIKSEPDAEGDAHPSRNNDNSAAADQPTQAAAPQNNEEQDYHDQRVSITCRYSTSTAYPPLFFMKDESVEDEPVKDESDKDEPIKDESVKDESVKDEPIKDESVKDESVKDEPFKDEFVKDEFIKDEPE
ncbi:hypothetical protein B0T24DRAFT_716492 [Lasiosphaeria ovina]|uniref:Uncharacterized protein n=1 Tax=Lasiosphaeria ovina TaxID=92902 RepID=A0AAE0KLE3_9PEZI|nr:hypothetical protein B0T24DRAFT_716492 [Lasiosphaeria ovina]